MTSRGCGSLSYKAYWPWSGSVAVQPPAYWT